MISLADHPDLLDLVKRWTADGAMRFRWPSDDEDALEFAAYYWTQHTPLEDLSPDPRAIDQRLRPVVGAITYGNRNEGPAVEAMLHYWHTVPVRNAKDMIDASLRIGAAVGALSEGVKAYKQAALAKLDALNDALNENQRWAWLPWSDDQKIDGNARALIGQFDDSILSSRQRQELLSLTNRAAAIVTAAQQLFERVAKPLPKDLDDRRKSTFGT